MVADRDDTTHGTEVPVNSVTVVLTAVSDVSGGDDVDTFLLVVGLLGGLALFLLGLDAMTESLRLIAGDRLRNVLGRLTDNRFAGLLTGAGVTALIQSSSVTTVLVVGFITSGLMTFRQSISVIIGANIGTTVTAQIIAFNITTVALIAMALGFGIRFFAKQGKRQTQGTVVLGFGLVFFGMSVMGDAMAPLRSSDTFIDIMSRLETPVLGIAVGAAFTALVQSSSATTGIVIVLAQQGLITLETGVALILGANVGTAVTAVLAAIGKSREAHRAAAAHVLFNVLGVLIWLPAIGLLIDVVSDAGGGTARQVANAHAVFNIANAAIFVFFVGRIGALIERLLPVRPGEGDLVTLKYLEDSLLMTPLLALDRSRLEIMRMASRVRTMLVESLPAVLRGSRWTLLEIEQGDDEVDSLHGQIIEYLGRVGKTRLGDAAVDELIALTAVTNNLEAIGDVIETNLIALGLRRVEQNTTVSDETYAIVAAFHTEILAALDLAIDAFASKDPEAARRSLKMKKHINSLERGVAAHQAQRLVADEPERVAAYRLETDVVANLRRIYYYTRRIARAAVPKDEPVELGGREA